MWDRQQVHKVPGPSHPSPRVLAKCFTTALESICKCNSACGGALPRSLTVHDKCGAWSFVSSKKVTDWRGNVDSKMVL